MTPAGHQRTALGGARADASVLRRIPRGAWVVLAALWLVAAALPAPALVFSPGHGDSDPVRGLAPDAQPAYQATLQLNGGTGGVDVRVCPGSVAAVLERLIGAYREQGALAFCQSGDRLGWGVVLQNGRVIRLLAAQVGRRPSCLLFRFEQSEQNFTHSENETPALPPGLPAYPGSRLTRLLRNADTGTSLAFSSATADPAEVLGYMQRALTDAGWTPALGARDETSGVYLKGSELMCVTVNSAGKSGRCVITVLHRRLKAKPDA